VTYALLLTSLAVFDLTLAGFRSAAGRDGRIHKKQMLRGAMLRGAIGGLALVALHAAIVGVLVATGDASTWPALVAAARDAVIVFGVFATSTALALAFWFAPLQELRLIPTLVVRWSSQVGWRGRLCDRASRGCGSSQQLQGSRCSVQNACSAGRTGSAGDDSPADHGFPRGARVE